MGVESYKDENRPTYFLPRGHYILCRQILPTLHLVSDPVWGSIRKGAKDLVLCPFPLWSGLVCPKLPVSSSLSTLLLSP